MAKSDIRGRCSAPCRRVVSGLLFALALSGAAAAQPPERFASPESAVLALIHAIRHDDVAALEHMLGPDAEPLVASGDPVEDHGRRQRFLRSYDTQHRIESDGAAKATLVVGAEAWPMPIPLVGDKVGWHFDSKAGAQEILDRRIGRNERDTIKSCLAYVEAQRDYAAQDRTGSGVREYAQRFLSSEGRHDGLYWPAAPGEEESPIGPLVASAQAEGYEGADPQPYHGYLFRILTQQGPSAAGGAYDYVADGHMIGGFALVAIPVRWGDSGVMTFIVNQDGKVFEKNLGPGTATLAGLITAYDPDSSWHETRESGSGGR